jgi:hypothetical protein
MACAQQPFGLFQTTGAKIGLQQRELDQIVLRAALDEPDFRAIEASE